MKSFWQGVSIELSEERRSTRKFLYAVLKAVTKREDWGLVAGTKENVRTMLVQEVHGLVVRYRYQQSLEEEQATLFHQNKEVKMSRKRRLSKLKLADSTFTQDEELIAEDCWQFFYALLNGRHDKDLRDTGQTFQPSHEHLPECLAGLPTLSQQSSEELVYPPAEGGAGLPPCRRRSWQTPSSRARGASCRGWTASVTTSTAPSGRWWAMNSSPP